MCSTAHHLLPRLPLPPGRSGRPRGGARPVGQSVFDEQRGGKAFRSPKEATASGAAALNLLANYRSSGRRTTIFAKGREWQTIRTRIQGEKGSRAR